jgi:superfamily II DNA helicase RecQ
LPKKTDNYKQDHIPPGFSSAQTFSSIDSSSKSASALSSTLQRHFGFSSFRGEQLEVIQAALSGRDCAVFWATGRGKSLCYQIPALHTGKMVLVVSPLISLMEDQVTKINNTASSESGGFDLACFLGSAQLDYTVEEAALKGKYRLVYVTPEKVTSPSFLSRMKQLEATVGHHAFIQNLDPFPAPFPNINTIKHQPHPFPL